MTKQLNLDVHRERESRIRCAKVYLAQSRHFTRLHRGWSFKLLEWAQKCRSEISAAKPNPAQMDLFDDMAVTRRAA